MIGTLESYRDQYFDSIKSINISMLICQKIDTMFWVSDQGHNSASDAGGISRQDKDT